MDSPGNGWKQHLVAVGFRLACMVAIALAGVVTGANPERPDGSEQAPGVAGLLFVAGAVAALVFAFITSTAHFIRRQRPLKSLLLADALLAAAFVTLMVYNGTRTRAASEGKPPAAAP